MRLAGAMLAVVLPLADARINVTPMTAADYYKLPVRVMYESYPIYHPDREPQGYLESLAKREPVVRSFDVAKFNSDEEWLRFGKEVFLMPTGYDSELFSAIVMLAQARDRNWYEKAGVPWDRKTGVVPYARYVIREKGKVEVGTLSCAMCHTRVMADGSIILGALARHGTSPLLPVQIPDLIGVHDRAYLDRTGLVQHRGIADLMRYAALNQGADYMTRFGDFVPGGENLERVPGSQKERYSDEQLLALAKFIYALRPPDNPNLPRSGEEKAAVAQGKQIFQRIGCGRCHRPPLYTNNKLTPVDGFAIPEEHLRRFAIVEFSLGTDPKLSLETRRGTVYYKIPSLLGVWYRGPFSDAILGSTCHPPSVRCCSLS